MTTLPTTRVSARLTNLSPDEIRMAGPFSATDHVILLELGKYGQGLAIEFEMADEANLEFSIAAAGRLAGEAIQIVRTLEGRLGQMRAEKQELADANAAIARIRTSLPYDALVAIAMALQPLNVSRYAAKALKALDGVTVPDQERADLDAVTALLARRAGRTWAAA